MAQDPANEREDVDFAYTIDCTASMSSYINAVKEDIEAVVAKMEEKFPQFRLRLACVGYRDWSDGDDRIESLDFTNNINSFKIFVSDLKAKGGGDEPEDVLGGLLKSSQLSWSSKLRVLYHICDAPPHNKKYHDEDCGDNYPDGHSSDPPNYHCKVLKSLKDKNIHLCIAKLNDSVTKMINVFTDYAKTIELTIEEKPVSDCDGLLTAISEYLETVAEARQVVKVVEKTCDSVKTDLTSLSFESNEQITKSEKKLDEIGTKVDQVTEDMEEASEQIEKTKEKVTTMKSDCPVVLQYAENAKNSRNEDEIDQAECKLEKINEDLMDITGEFAEARAKCSEAMSKLAEEKMKLAETETNAKKSTETKEMKIQRLKQQIMSLKSEIGKMSDAKTRNELKQRIKKFTLEVQSIYRGDAGLYKKIGDSRKTMLKTLKHVRERTKEVNEGMVEVQTQLDKVQTVLADM